MDRLHIEFDIDLPDDLFELAKVIAEAQAPVRACEEALGASVAVTFIPAQPAEPARRTRGPNKPKVVA